MSSEIISITLYMISVNLVTGIIYMFGQKKVGLLWIEYPFVYVPLIMFQLIMPQFVAISGLDEHDLFLKYFLFALQGFGCGIIGGMILLPRFFIPATTVVEKLKITMWSCLGFSALYLVNRWAFFEVLRWMIPQMRS